MSNSPPHLVLGSPLFSPLSASCQRSDAFHNGINYFAIVCCAIMLAYDDDDGDDDDGHRNQPKSKTNNKFPVSAKRL